MIKRLESELTMDRFATRHAALRTQYERRITETNSAVETGNGIYDRWKNPVLTHRHIPLHWRYDLNPETNPFLMERQGVNAVLNSGAILLDGAYRLIVRVEGNDRKSFFAVASSSNGVDNFEFAEKPIVMPETLDRDTNVYDMRITQHEDGWIYGIFCTERSDSDRPHDRSAAIAQCGIARTRNLNDWERLADLRTPSDQQRNAVLHPTFVKGKYAFYTRPQTNFIGAASAGIGFGLAESIEDAQIRDEVIVDETVFHTIKEIKNGQGPAPIRTDEGWLHLAHGVRNTCAGYRYVLYLFVTDIDEPWRRIRNPGGYLIAPEQDERIGDVSNVVFSNGWIANKDGHVHIYYASSDTRMHVATTTIEQLLDYARNTPEDPLFSADCVAERIALIDSNSAL